MARQARTFEDAPGERHGSPVLVGIMGPSGGGKTYSALRLATGIQQVVGGDVHVIDTEMKRALHYADLFKFRHVDFRAPFGSLDYLDAMRHCVSKGARVIVIDSMSHEHEGPGGLLDVHDKEQDRLAGGDPKRYEAVKMKAWQLPKRHRRELITGLLQLDCNFVFCFRAKPSVRMQKDQNGKMQVVPVGFMPIAGDELVFEMTLNALLLPGAKGVPTWQSDFTGERMMMKMPEQFVRMNLLPQGQVLDETIGQKLAQWAKGGQPTDSRSAARQELDQAPEGFDSDHVRQAFMEAAGGGLDALRDFYRALKPYAKTAVSPIMENAKKVAERIDERNRQSTMPQEGQGSPPASDLDSPPPPTGQDAPQQSLVAPGTPSGLNQNIGNPVPLERVDWYERGRQARISGLMLRAVPPEIREGHQVEVEAWRKGYMDEQNGVPRR